MQTLVIISQFSLAAWFKTSANFGSDAFIANKGGIGSDSSGENLNYGIWMTSTEQIKAGFETSAVADQYVTSGNTYNDGQWHYAVVTNDGSRLDYILMAFRWQPNQLQVQHQSPIQNPSGWEPTPELLHRQTSLQVK